MDKNGLFIVLLLLFMIVLDRSNALNPRKFLTTSDPNGSSKANQVNITFSGDKTTKVTLNAGNGDRELQIGARNTTTIDNPSNSKDVKDPADSPSKPKDTNIPADTPTKPKEADNPSKPKEADAPAKPKDVDAPPKLPKDDNDPSKSPKGDNDPSKSPKHAYAPPDPTSVDTSISQNNLLDQLSFYSKQVTPIYGAYFAFLVALIIGGSWAFCSFRKRRSEGEVLYQELEMGLPESSNAVDVETAEGWDQDWDDDDWDEDKAIRSPGGGIVQAKTISSNGLTSRATKKDNWDGNWDD